MVYLLIVVAAVVLIAAIAYGTQRKSRDGVASFKRQIDALSPEARKPVVDQVQSVSDLRRSSDTPKPGATPDPVTTGPGTTNGGATGPGTTNPVTTGPGTTGPGTTNAGTTDPDTTDADTTDAAVSDPGSSDDVKAADPADDPGDRDGS